MMEKCQKSLMEAAVQTFEDLGMMLLNEELTDDQKEAKKEASVMVTFSGPFSGRLEITVFGEITEKLARNISGSEELSSDILPLDALGEIANVICGNVLPKIANVRDIFHLTSPAPLNSEQTDQDAEMVMIADSHLGLEDGRAEIKLLIDETAGKTLESVPQ
ncbi:MAG: chemotaxis protein CheX [candidate division Zixibacteria bacterium]|nr:chemotaxis protein CheX [candidate division Zixibacteria bacterium]